MKIAITSVSGNLGSAVARQLIQKVGADKVIRKGFFNVPSDFEKAAGRKHKSLVDIIRAYNECAA